uniref:FAM91 C-terminal domain-containing protein n=1 Tax=Cercocebus atys TaxID=9531 RepID=A0A2K5NB65_CERAT
MNIDVEFHIWHNYSWNKLPANVRQSLIVFGNSQREYEKQVVLYGNCNQLRYRNNLVKHVKKDERRYYEELSSHAVPHHLSDIMVKGLRITSFSYYTGITEDVMNSEKSYDSLPNFTAADCLRFLGIGRNLYIDHMNQCRSSKQFFRKKTARDLLPIKPVEITIEVWWVVQAGYITEDDIKIRTLPEKCAIDKITDSGPQLSGSLDYNVVHSFIYLDVPISDDSYTAVPPLEGFVMNQVQGDHFETLLYKILVSIDEHTNAAELANVLEIDLCLVKNAVSVYCRLGFAHKKGQIHRRCCCHGMEGKVGVLLQEASSATDTDTNSQEDPADTTSVNSLSLSTGHTKRIAFLFDSTLTAFLMMGNLSPVQSAGEGEAQRYFDHALTLRNTILFLHHKKNLVVQTAQPDQSNYGFPLDLLRCESLLDLDPATCSRVVNKNYTLLVSMAPLTNETWPVSSCTPQHIGPAIPEVSSVWFKLYIYHIAGQGPPSVLLSKGTRLRKLPDIFQSYDRLLITSWDHDPEVVPTSNVLKMLNDALTHSAVLIQGHGLHGIGETVHVPFPFDETELQGEFTQVIMGVHKHLYGYVAMLNASSQLANGKLSDASDERGEPDLASGSDVNGSTESFEMVIEEATIDSATKQTSGATTEADWVPSKLCFGILLFSSELNQKVCRKIDTHGLCRKQSLQNLLDSILNFVHSFQEGASTLDIHTEPRFSSLLSQSSYADMGVPLPAKNFIFKDGVLSEGSGQSPSSLLIANLHLQ